MTVDERTVRQAMTRFPSGVTIVTMVDDAPVRWASSPAPSRCSHRLTARLVCLDRSANCYPHFCKSDLVAINVLSPHHEALARRFATKGIDRSPVSTSNPESSSFPCSWMRSPRLKATRAP
jgi:flavin reductase ActVB